MVSINCPILLNDLVLISPQKSLLDSTWFISNILHIIFWTLYFFQVANRPLFSKLGRTLNLIQYKFQNWWFSMRMFALYVCNWHHGTKLDIDNAGPFIIIMHTVKISKVHFILWDWLIIWALFGHSEPPPCRRYPPRPRPRWYSMAQCVASRFY